MEQISYATTLNNILMSEDNSNLSNTLSPQQEEHKDVVSDQQTEFRSKRQKPKTGEGEEDQNSFFFTMVNVEGKLNKRDREDSQEESSSKEEEEISERQISPLEDVKLLLERFNKYDSKLQGMIPLEDAKDILVEMGVDVEDFDIASQILIMTKETHCTFDQFLAILKEMEDKRLHANDKGLFIKRDFKTDPRLIAFIKLLDEYRRKNEQQGEYKEAKSAKIKIQEIKEKEAVRREAILRVIHSNEITNLEGLQRQQFQDFSDEWDKYMSDYEKAALDSLETLKCRHIKDLEDYDCKIKEEVPKVYYSKQVLELRNKEKNLVKLQQYEKAAKVRVKIDDLEGEEENQHVMDTTVSLQNKIHNFRVKQTSTLNALLKKIQKDRNQQLKQRQLDSERLMVKNRNMRNELLHRHQDEIKRAVESLRDLLILDQPSKDRKRVSSQMAFK